ncbi:hypothetical protein EMCRGX_G026926 [Ephydatia muelleri]
MAFKAFGEQLSGIAVPHYTMSAHDSQEPSFIHEKLKGQVTLSIKEALDKATGVLSNLHRVQSYLDVIKTMTSSRTVAHPEGIHSALDQVKSLRNDTATLLQTIYLAEIGLQSMQEFDKPGNQLISAVSDTLSNGNGGITSDHQHTVTPTEGGVMVVDVDMPGDIDFGAPSTAKKDTDLSAVIFACTHCGRRFATQRFEDNQLCKTCRLSVAQGPAPAPAAGSSNAPISASQGDTVPTYSSTPIFQKPGRGGKRGNIPPMSCKICNVSFHYKRCLFRHLKENHSGIDVNNLQKYIDATSNQPVKKPKMGEDTSLCVNIGSDVHSSIGDSSGHSDSGLVSHVDPSIGQVGGAPSSEGLAAESLLTSSGILSLDGDMVEGLPLNQSLNDDSKIKPGSQFICTSCSKVFDRPYRLQRHMQIHNPNRPRVSCDICDRTFTRLDTLENHMKCLHTEERPFRCVVESCNKTFATQSTLFHHQKTHTNGKPYNCHECDMSFALLNEYKLHMKDSHSDTQDLRCSECYRVFVSAAEVDKHKLAEHRLECEICGKTFARLAYLKMHVQIHDGDNLFNCQFCSTGFDTEYAYKQHLRIHPEYQTARRTYHCQVCEKVFQHPSNLVVHYRSQKHRERTSGLDINTSSILSTIEGNDLSREMGALVDEVTMSSDEDNLIQSIADNDDTDDYGPTVVTTETKA